MSEEFLIDNTQIESMFMRVANDDNMQKFVQLSSQSKALATAYASNMVTKVFYRLLDSFEAKEGNIEDLKSIIKSKKK